MHPGYGLVVALSIPQGCSSSTNAPASSLLCMVSQSVEELTDQSHHSCTIRSVRWCIYDRMKDSDIQNRYMHHWSGILRKVTSMNYLSGYRGAGRVSLSLVGQLYPQSPSSE